MKKILSLLLLTIIFMSCSTMSENDRIVRRSDIFHRLSKNKLMAVSGWKMGDTYLKLRKNNTFISQDRVLGFVKSGYYAGRYTFKNDTLRLFFKNNHKPSALKSEILILKKTNDGEILDTNTGYFLWVQKNKLAAK